MAAWFTNLHEFRTRSLVERLFWSLPLSMAISPIASVLIGKFLGLTTVVGFFVACGLLCSATVVMEWLRVRRTGEKWVTGLQPLGAIVLMVAGLWVALVVSSLVDFESNHQLYMSVALLDQSYRINWTESVLRSGIPPNNPLYLYKSPAVMRNYYYWYVLCAAVSKMARLPVRAVITGGCVWAGLILGSLNGLYLKYFLDAGGRLRKQLLRSVGLLMVTGLDICVILWNAFYFHLPLSSNPEDWSKDPVVSWLDTLLWSPHHVVAMVCCMLAFLLAWMAAKSDGQWRFTSVLLIGAALASAFGLSVYVTFAFFLVMICWGIWQVTFEHRVQPTLLLGVGGVCALILLLPYLIELTHASSGMEGGSAFAFYVRQMIPPEKLLSSGIFQQVRHSQSGQVLAKLVLLAPGYVLEFGVYLVVLFIYLIPAWRVNRCLSPAHRSLVFIAVSTIPLTSLLRSSVLTINDFGMRSALLVQYPLLLLASELVTSWSASRPGSGAVVERNGSSANTPHWVRSITTLFLAIGIFGTVYQVFVFRFIVPLVEAGKRANHDPAAGDLAHNAYISAVGYKQLNTAIPTDGITQYNPAPLDAFWALPDVLGINHQVAISTDQGLCGSELGGDPSGCPAISAAIDALYRGASSEQARAACQQYGIQFLIARIYDSAWKDRHSWVWTLRPVVSDEEFRVLACRE
jgi:hypothetical protein